MRPAAAFVCIVCGDVRVKGSIFSAWMNKAQYLILHVKLWKSLSAQYPKESEHFSDQTAAWKFRRIAQIGSTSYALASAEKNDGLPTGNVLFLSLNGFCLNSESHTALCPWRKPVLVVTLCNTTSCWRAYIAAVCQESHCPECRMTLQLQCAPNLGLTGNGRSLNFLTYTLGGTFRKGPLEAINWLLVWARPF